MFSLKPPRHIPTLPIATASGSGRVRCAAESRSKFIVRLIRCGRHLYSCAKNCKFENSFKLIWSSGLVELI